MARVFNETAWRSDKIYNIQPAEWRPECAWVYSIALADGTFEASPRMVWMAAYASVRPDWSIEKVGKLLDEFSRVGLLQRATDADGKVWGRWVGSERYLPTKERCEKKRYKTGRGDLFTVSADAAPPQHQTKVLDLDLGQLVGSGLGKGEGVGVDSAAKDAKNEQPQEQQQKRTVPSSLSSIPTDQPQEQPQEQQRSDRPQSDRPRSTPATMKSDKETIGEHFDGVLTIHSLSDGNLDDDVTWGKEELEQLNECVALAVSERASRPYCGLKTNASLMGDAMKLMQDNHEKNVPPPWLPVMNMLREAATTTPKARPTPPPPDPRKPSEWHVKNGYEFCADNIWRPASDRATGGFTVKGEYEAAGKTYNIWSKPAS